MRFSTWRHPTPCWKFSVLTVGIFLFQCFLWLGLQDVVFPVYVVCFWSFGIPRFWPAGLFRAFFGLSFDLLVIRHALLLAFWPFWHALHLAFLRLSGLALGSPVLWRLDMSDFALSTLLQAFWPTSGFLAYFRLSGLLQVFWPTSGFLAYSRLSDLLLAFWPSSGLLAFFVPSGMPRFCRLVSHSVVEGLH